MYPFCTVVLVMMVRFCYLAQKSAEKKTGGLYMLLFQVLVGNWNREHASKTKAMAKFSSACKRSPTVSIGNRQALL